MLTKPVLDGFVTANDLTFHYVKWGEQGPSIICLHALTTNAFSYQALADDLAQDHQLYAYDLRGRGDSDKPEQGYSVPIHAADLAQLIDAWGLKRPILMGHSLGALIALYFAGHYPDKLSKLILIDAGAPLPWNTPEEQPAWLTASISRLGISIPSFEEYTQRLKLAPFLGSYWNEYIETFFSHDVQRSSDGSVASKTYREGILEEGQRYPEAQPEKQWGNVQVPTLLLRAGQGMFSDNDQLLPEAAAEAARQSIKDCRFVNYPTLNHYTIIFAVEPGPVQDIRAFIDEK